MNGGSKFFASAAVVALAGCGGSEPKLEIRSTPTPLSATAKPVPFRIAEANGHLALGNVALALESYRKALREQPNNVAAMVGLADCYERMARFDLSRRYYEEALAIAPADTKILTALARSLDAQGQAEDATAVRKEIAVRLAAAARASKRAIEAAPALPKLALHSAPVAGSSVTIALPPPRPVVAAPKKAPPPPSKLAKVRQAAAPAPAPRPIAPPAAAAAPAVRPQPVQQAAVARANVPRPVAPPPLAALVSNRPKPVQQLAAASIPRPTPAAPAPVMVANPVAVPQPVAAPVALPRPAARAPAPVAAAPVVAAPTMAPAPKLVQLASAVPKPAPRPVAPPPVAKAAPVATAASAAKPKPVQQAAADPAPAIKLAANVAEVTRAPLPSAPAPVGERIDPPVKVVEPVAPPPVPVAIARSALAASIPSLAAPTRLERLSPGEVVLVTTGKPQWRSQVVGRTAQSTTIRYVPLRTAQQRMAQARTVNIRLLNAARYRGLAARTQKLLATRGWRQLAIGDATRVRRTSLILYPAHRRATAERLAKQFGFPIEKRASGNEFVMLLGRDARFGDFGTGG